MAERDEWAVSAGLLDDTNVTVMDATFGFDAEYNNGQTCCLVLTLKDDDGEDHKQLLPCGEGWEPAAGGDELARTDGKNKSLNGNSAYGKFLSHAIALAPELRERGNPKTAKTWVGTAWHVVREQETFTLRDGTERTVSRLIPDAYNGASGGSGEAKTVIKGETKAAANTNGVEPAIRLKLTKCAKDNDTFDAYMQAALGIDGVAGVAACEALVIDEAFYTAARG